MKASSKRLGEILIQKGLITPKQLEDALKEQNHERKKSCQAVDNKRIYKRVDKSVSKYKC